jgi:hypothetical protein
MCGLLASPDVDDPLVPEIAQKYIEDYNGYCENARLYTQRFATEPRPKYQNLVFSEDISHGDIEMNWVHSNNLHSKSTSDAVSLSKSLPPSSPDLFEGWDLANVFEATSIHLEADNLYFYIDGRNLGSSWQLSGKDRSETTVEGQSKSTGSSATPLLKDLIRSTKHHLLPSIARLEGGITDFKICHSLLEAADAYLFRGSGHYFNPEDHLAASAFYKEAQNLCGDFLADCLATSKTKVQVLGHIASISYRISITGTAKDDQTWNITKALDQVKDLNAFLIVEFPDARIWGWDGTPTALDEPHSQVFALLLEHGLKRVFRSHAVQLLKRREFLSFVTPDFKPWTEPRPAPLIAVPKAVRSMPSISTLIQSFIHPSLMSGIGVSMAEMTNGNVSRVDSARLWLETRYDWGVDMGLVVKWHNGQQFFDFRYFTSVLREYPNTPIKNNKHNSLSIIYRLTTSRGQTTPRFLSMLFQSSEETELCFGALQALCQIDKLLREIQC